MSLLLYAGSISAQDQQAQDFSVFLQSDVIHQSNVFKFSDESAAEAAFGSRELADTYVKLGVGAEASLPISRQVIQAQVAAYRYQYNNFGFLDRTDGNVFVSWDWLLGERLIGRLEGGYERKIQDFADSRLTEVDVRDDLSVRTNLTYLFTRAWRLKLAGLLKDQEHDLEERSRLNRTLVRGVAELRYFTPKRSFVGFRSAVAEADFPDLESVDGDLVDNSYQETQNGLIARWNISAASQVTADLGLTQREYEDVSERDFDGATWGASYIWKPRKRYRLTLAAWRDLEAFSDAVTSHVIETGVGLDVEWALTPVSSLTFNLASKQRDFEGDADLLEGSAVRKDDLLSYGVTGEVELMRSLTVDMGFLYEERDSNSDQWDFDCYTVEIGVKASFF